MENKKIDSDIEVLTLDEVEVKEVEKKETNKNTKKRKKRRLKKGVFQTIFCLISLIFIIVCCIIYGSRLIKYYKIYNPKSESGEVISLLHTEIVQKSPIVLEGEGLYRENGLYVYKGENVNNYIKYSNMIWRIVRTNVDGSLEIILDDYINILAWDFKGNEYIKSDIHAYLNDVFVKSLNTDLLANTSICTEVMDSIDKFSCNKTNVDYLVKLIPANDFLNSIMDGKTYISKKDELVWLGTTAKEEKAWLANGGNISTSEDNNTYFIKPVVTLKNSTQLMGGNGTIDNPYQIEQNDNNIKIGSYLTLGEDNWIVYEKNDKTLKLVYGGLYNKGLSTYRFDTDELDYNPERDNSLAKLLNGTFYESLSYKDLLKEFDVYTGTYQDTYKNVYEEKVIVKVGIPSAVDIKIDNTVDGYFLSSKSPREGRIYYYQGDLISSKPGISRPYRPVIMIEIPKISEGEGTKENPFKVEV